MRKPGLLLVVTLCLVFFAGSGNNVPQVKGVNSNAANPATLKADTDYGKMPLYFIPNEGQMDKQVAYYVQGKDKTLYFTAEGITIALTEPADKKEAASRLDPGMRGRQTQEKHLGQHQGAFEQSARSASARWVVKLEFLGAEKGVRPVGESATGTVMSYFKGGRQEWLTGMPTYSRIVYTELWPGIDLVYHGTANRLKYEFIVHPGADPSNIRLAYQGAEKVQVDENGRLQVATPVGGFSDDAPSAYQVIEGTRIDVSLAYQLGASDKKELLQDFGDGGAEPQSREQKQVDTPGAEHPAPVGSYGFKIGAYDHSQTLVLDPAVLIYCGFIGGTGEDIGDGIAVDGSGNVYVTGSTQSTEAAGFPVSVGPDVTQNGNLDVFVAKVNAAGTGLVYCGYIGGTGDDNGYDIAVDGTGNAYVTGATSSAQNSFPVTGGPDLIYNGGEDVFVAKVNASGAGLDYCGYIGGSANDRGFGIAVDSSGNAYVTGDTLSAQDSFPVSVGPDSTYNGDSDAFVAKVNSSGTGLMYCGYIGGANSDFGDEIAVDGQGNAYVTGDAFSTEVTFPVIVGPDLTYNGGQSDVFVAKVNAFGTGLDYCGYIGGVEFDFGYGIAVDGAGSAYVTGMAHSSETTFPVKVGPDLAYNGGGDAFVAKVEPSGAGLEYCGYIGGDNEDVGRGIALDASGNAYVTGYTASSGRTFPVTVGPDLIFNGGTYDAFAAKVNASGTKLISCGYIGGSGSDSGLGIAVDGAGIAYITGYTASTQATFPVAVGPDLTQNGNNDAFVAKISYVGKNDFNGDGQEDILWRYYSTGGYNVVWYMGSSAAGLASMEGSVMNRPVGQYKVIDMLQGQGSKQIFADAREPGMMLSEKAPQQVFRDPREAGGLPERGGRESREAQRQRGVFAIRGAGEIRGAGGNGLPVMKVAALTWTGNGWLPAVTDINWQIAGTGDFNRDGKTDILWRNYGAGGDNVVWYMDGVNWTGNGWLPAVTDPNWKIAGTGDFNGDGKVDILWRNYGAGGYNAVWYMDGVNLVASEYLPAVTDTNWEIAGTGDFNGDGKVDIVWRNYGAGGDNVVWYLNGVNWAGNGWLLSVTDPNWKIEGTGDFNGDGKADIVWRNYGAGGDNVIWYLDGVNWTGNEWLPAVADINWRIENH